jgi:hypothetical protein
MNIELQMINQTPDLYFGGTEVQQYADLKTGRCQVIQALRDMNAIQGADRFYLHQYSILSE